MDQRETDTTDGIARSASRRRILSLGGAGILSVLGGCSSNIGGSTSSPGQADESVFKSASTQGRNLVVTLREDHGIERLNLIGPDGRNYASSTVAAGSTRSKLRLLEIVPSDSFHYPIGESTLVAVKSGENIKKKLRLRPKLEVSNITQYSGDRNRNFGNIAITVRNQGTAPTWVYDIFFPDAPYFEARKEGDGKGSPGVYLKEPSKTENATILPDSKRRFVDSHPPFLFEKKSDCEDNSINTTANLRLGSGETLSFRLRAEFSGEPVAADAASFDKMYACKDGNIVLYPKTETDE